MAISAGGPKSGGAGGLMKSKNSKPEEIRRSNIQAAKALSDAVRTSLGPRGMDKMIQVTHTLPNCSGFVIIFFEDPDTSGTDTISYQDYGNIF